MSNRFLDAMAQTAQTENGALSNSTTGFGKYGSCLDYFAKAGTYADREQIAVNSDMASIFSDDEIVALKIIFGLRLITRNTKADEVDIDSVQTGYGRKDEFYKAIVWMHHNKKELLYRNLHLIPIFGCWKDFLTEPLIDVLDRNAVIQLFMKNINDDLVKKYLPQIRSKKNQRSDRDKKRTKWALQFIRAMNIDNREYRKIKTSGNAHTWQVQMGRGEFDKIEFTNIPGKAITKHINNTNREDKKTVFERHNQTQRLTDWVLKQNIIKFNGYPYELVKFAKNTNSELKTNIYNKQFESIIKQFEKHSLGNVLCALDTSGSMTSDVVEGVSAYDICLSMGLVFSYLNNGFFKDVVAMFDEKSRIIKLKGSFVDRINYIEKSQANAMGNTNFQSVIDEIVKVRMYNPEIPVSEFPETLLVVSDMQFDYCENSNGQSDTNYKVAMEKLRKVGLGSMRIIWWNVRASSGEFPSQMNDKGVYMISGFDPTNIKALMGLNKTNQTHSHEKTVNQTPLDGMMNFLSQPIFNLIRI